MSQSTNQKPPHKMRVRPGNARAPKSCTRQESLLALYAIIEIREDLPTRLTTNTTTFNKGDFLHVHKHQYSGNRLQILNSPFLKNVLEQ